MLRITIEIWRTCKDIEPLPAPANLASMKNAEPESAGNVPASDTTQSQAPAPSEPAKDSEVLEQEVPETEDLATEERIFMLPGALLLLLVLLALIITTCSD